MCTVPRHPFCCELSRNIQYVQMNNVSPIETLKHRGVLNPIPEFACKDKIDASLDWEHKIHKVKSHYSLRTNLYKVYTY